MEKLPTEVLHKIFIELELHQRLICLLVCRSWWRVLEKYSLFYTVEIKQCSKYSFDKNLSKFVKSPALAAQVRELYIKPHPNINRLLNIFPNTRIIKVECNAPRRISKSTPAKKPIVITHSKSKVNFLSDFGRCELTSQILHSNLGARLGTLWLSFYGISDTSVVLSRLKNLPVLKKLSLKSPTMTLQHLEDIHKNIPSIQDFNLKNIKIKASNMPCDIIPASITTFSFLHGRFRDKKTHTQFYQYMTQKYINISTAEYEDNMIEGYDSNDRREIFLNGVLDFFKLIGPSQTRLNLNRVPDGVDIFGALDAVGSQIKKLHFEACEGETMFNYLSQSKQAHHVQEISTLNSSVDSMRFLANMTALTTIKLMFFDIFEPQFQLVDVLNGCPPSLKHLSITCFHLVVDPFTTVLASVETLELHSKSLTGTIGDIVSYCFPNLVQLVLFGSARQDIRIMLRSPHFEKATFSRGDGGYATYGFAFKCPIETQYYFCQKTKNTRVQQENIKRLPTMSVELLTEKTLLYKDKVFYVLSS
jgi:hypothetical protein